MIPETENDAITLFSAPDWKKFPTAKQIISRLDEKKCFASHFLGFKYSRVHARMTKLKIFRHL